MSTITATPVPSIGRKPFVIGLAALGVVAVGAVVLPHLHTTTTSVTTAVSPVQAPDSLSRRDAMRAQQQAQSSVAIERKLDQQDRAFRHATMGVSTGTQAFGAASVAQQQIGGLHHAYTWTPSTQHPLILRRGGLAAPGKLALTWSDRYVPPVDDPAWVPFIRAHYYGGTVPERIVTRGD